ncbi:hypothetical protein, partial [Defluviimonas salinarum]
KVILKRALEGAAAAGRRGNTPLLDVEDWAQAPCEASTRIAPERLDAAAERPEIPVSSGRGRC